MLTRASIIASLLLAALAAPNPQRNRGQTAQQQAAKIPQGVSQAIDGSTILDSTAQINGLNIRYKISAPAAMFKAASNVTGAQAAPGDQSSMGINVLLHGDGGQSFFDFPNQAVQQNVMGVAVLAPDPNLFWGGGSGLNRVNGAAHSKAVNDLVKNVLPNMVAFNQSQVYFTGVSGGSLLLSGYFIPTQMQNFVNSAVLLACGAMPPQIQFQDAQNVIQTTRIHYQSTVNELQLLQGSIPKAVTAYEQIATSAGMTPDQIGALQTIDNTPQGGHCAFDGQSFVSGVQLISNNYARIVQPGGDGNVQGIGNVLKSVVGNEQPTFGPERRQKY
ncbi:uncharacterized protein PV09_00455 [Verruconis gallopava]|uniref:Cyclin-like f-box protein n=1 Tax=Verruconis gallopava TaxID=253628 RepID=A0A0D2ASB1_9PEZI|nr:uncharacterized protein PV09_00455 [Verruconis gallopava]KIW09583.1 hypothetical protein PV09_00455 [Verruconis gallopava]